MTKVLSVSVSLHFLQFKASGNDSDHLIQVVRVIFRLVIVVLKTRKANCLPTFSSFTTEIVAPRATSKNPSWRLQRLKFQLKHSFQVVRQPTSTIQQTVDISFALKALDKLRQLFFVCVLVQAWSFGFDGPRKLQRCDVIMYANMLISTTKSFCE